MMQKDLLMIYFAQVGVLIDSPNADRMNLVEKEAFLV
tara:strand:- start:142 stop:252 length:111 start_codon:yes stop_codon:yes gene_type:complete